MPTATITPITALRTGWGREQLLAHQRVRLQALLRDAIARSPFHARRLTGVDPRDIDPADLSALPVMTKAQMMDELDDVFTDRRLTRASAASTCMTWTAWSGASSAR